MTIDLSAVIKPNDVRGRYGKELTDQLAFAVGQAFAEIIVLPQAQQLVLGYDMRVSSPALKTAFSAGAAAVGVEVIDLGLCSTDAMYFASGVKKLPGAMITASHNGAEYNGIKLCRALAKPVGQDSGLALIRDRVAELLDDPQLAKTAIMENSAELTSAPVLPAYAQFLRDLVPLTSARKLKVVIDAGNAVAGVTAPAVLGDAAGLTALNLEIVPLYFELDGSFPNHEANPLEPENMRDLQAAVIRHQADLGLAFDGDADRCFVVDEKGDAVSASAITSLIGLQEAARVSANGEQAVVVHNLIVSQATIEQLQSAGVETISEKVGHSFIKATMAARGAVFGGEHSAHYYFRDFFFADSGMLAALHVLAALGRTDKPLSALVADFSPYYNSGEINSVVADKEGVLAAIAQEFVSDSTVTDSRDGLKIISWGDEQKWWLNVRASNTEPLVRLNVEANSEELMQRITETALKIIQAP